MDQKYKIDSAIFSLLPMPTKDWFYLVSCAMDNLGNSISSDSVIPPEMRLPAAIALFLQVNAGAALVALGMLDAELQLKAKQQGS